MSEECRGSCLICGHDKPFAAWVTIAGTSIGVCDDCRAAKDQLAQVTQERDEARAREAGLLRRIWALPCESQDGRMATGIALSTVQELKVLAADPSPAFDEWKRMRAVCELTDEIDQIDAQIYGNLAVGPSRFNAALAYELRGKRLEKMKLLNEALAAWKEARP